MEIITFVIISTLRASRDAHLLRYQGLAVPNGTPACPVNERLDLVKYPG
jgi:hypothetical protein